MCKKPIYLISLVLVLGLVGSAYAQVGKGNILFEYWFDSTINNNLDTLRAHPDFPDNPHDSEWRTIFEGDVTWNNNYGTRVRGYVYPPQTGEYIFWLATDDDGELHLSTDDNPANATMIAYIEGWAASREWTKFPEQQSNPVTLQAGQKYYIEALQSEGGGGDNLAVAWAGPGIGAGPVVIDGMYLSPWLRRIDLIATNPGPADGATGVMSPALMWTAGKAAKFHDVYLGTSPDLGPADLVTTPFYQWNMYWHLPGFTAGVTYYWRVDEVEADGTTTYTGDVWSFTAAPYSAYNPDPADGARFVNPDADLSWAPGSAAISHDVYFGTDETEVTNGTGGTFKGNQTGTTYEPGTLARDTRYFWRIDEKDNGMIYTGDVWSFKTLPDIPITDPDLIGWWKFDAGAGTTAIDWSGHENHGTLYGGAQWVDGYYSGAIDFDGTDDYVGTGKILLADVSEFTLAGWVSARNPGDSRIGLFGQNDVIEMGFNGGNVSIWTSAAGTTQTAWSFANNTWHHVAAVADATSVTIYLDGESAVSGAGAANYGSSGFQFNIGGGGVWDASGNWFDGAIDDVRVYSKALTQQELADAMQGDPTLARNPSPDNGSTPDIEHATPLSWTPGKNAAKHDVYFGTDEDAVQDADTTTTGIYRGRQDPNTYTPPGGVEFNQTYYWRIDEFNTDATISEGRVWGFTVADYLSVDDFEAYDDYCNRIFYTWGDGWGHSGDLTCGVPSYDGNGTGSTVGYLSEPYAEQTITHDGSFQSMPMEFINDGSTGKALYSETERTFDTPQDWTRHGVKALTLWFRGLPGSDGSFSYDPGTDVYTVTSRSGDIWGQSDEFHYAYKQLSGQGAIEVKVLSADNTAGWVKAGVMIRETLEPNSPHAFMFITPNGRRAFQNRPTKGGDSVSAHSATGEVSTPYWVRLVRQGNMFTAYHSTDGVNWEMQPDNENTGGDASPNPQTIPMAVTVYVGLALTSNNTGTVCEATFSDVTITGTVTGQWQSQDIGIASNDAEQLYVALEDSTGTAKDVPHPDPNAAQLNTWQEWNIDLAEFAPVDLTRVKKMYIGVGDRDAPKLGGGGMLYIDDIRLYPPRCYPALVKPAGDFDNNCVVDYPDLDIMTDNWLMTDYDVTPVAPSDANLVAYYALENNTLDGSGSNNHGDPCGAPIYVPGRVGTAMEFDGVDDYVDTGYTEDLTNWTITCWVISPAAPSGASPSGPVHREQNYQFNWNHGSATFRGAAAVNVGGVWYAASYSPLEANTWYHLAATYDGEALRAYRNGLLITTNTAPSGPPSAETNSLKLGRHAAAAQFFTGTVDEARVYSRVLSQAEIGSLAGRTAPYTQDLYLLLTPQDPAIDMNSDDTIDLKDYALLADMFLDEILWP